MTPYYTPDELLNNFAGKQPKKEHKLQVIKLWKLSTSRDGPVKIRETRKGWKYKKTILLLKKHSKERLEDYSTSVASPRVVFYM